MTSTLTTVWTQQAALGALDRFQWKVFPLNEDKRLLLKEQPDTFKFRFGRELNRHANGCFGENNLHLERGKKDRKRTALWRVAFSNTEALSVTLGEKHVSLTQESADSADSADSDSVKSQEKNKSLSQNDGLKHECEND